MCLYFAFVALFPFALQVSANATTVHIQAVKTSGCFAEYQAPSSPQPTRKSVTKPASRGPESLRQQEILSLYCTLFTRAWNESPEIQMARTLQKQKYSERYSAWANRFSPQLDFEISQKRFFNQDEDATASEDELLTEEEYKDGEDVTDWQFDLDLPLYKRSLSVAMDIATLEYTIASNNLAIKTQELDTTLYQLLSNYMVACYQLLNIKNSIVLSSEHVQKIQRGFELRDQTKLALLRAQANLKELEAREELNEQKRDTTFRELLDFTAIPEPDPIWSQLGELLRSEGRVAGCINSLADLPRAMDELQLFLSNSTTDNDLQDSFVANSLLYKQVILERDLGKSKAQKYTQSEFPSLSIQGELTRKDDTRFNEYSGEGSIGLVLTVPLFSGGTLVSTFHTTNMATELALIQEHSTLLRSIHSIANKKKSIISLKNVFSKQVEHLQQQQEIVRLSLKSYQIKQTSMQDLLTSKNSLIDAKNLLMRTTADLGILLRQFAREIGSPFPPPVELQPKN